MAFSTVLNLSIKKHRQCPVAKEEADNAMSATTFSPAIFSTTPFQVPGVIGSALPSDEELILYYSPAEIFSSLKTIIFAV